MTQTEFVLQMFGVFALTPLQQNSQNARLQQGSGQSLTNTFPAFIFSSGNRKRELNALFFSP